MELLHKYRDSGAESSVPSEEDEDAVDASGSTQVEADDSSDMDSIDEEDAAAAATSAEPSLGQRLRLYGHNRARGWTLLHKAAKSNRRDMMRAMISQGEDLRSHDFRGRTALHLAAKRGHTKMCQLLMESDPELLTATDSRGRTPIHYAIRAPPPQTQGSRVITAAELLLNAAYGDAVDDIPTDAKGRTLYHYAAKYNNVVIMRLLEERGGQLCREILNSSRDRETDRSPLHDAVIQGSQGAVDELLGEFGGRDLWVPVFDLDQYGSTFLHYAADKGNVNILKYLNFKQSDFIAESISLKVRGKIEERLWCADKKGNTVLHRAAATKQAEFLTQVTRQVTWPAHVLNQENSRGLTALMVAVDTGCPRTVAALLEANANSNSKDREHCTVLHHAVRANSEEVAALLLQHPQFMEKDALSGEHGTALDLAWSLGYLRLVHCLSQNGCHPAKEDALLPEALFSLSEDGRMHRSLEDPDEQKAMCDIQAAFYGKVAEKVQELKDKDPEVTCRQLLHSKKRDFEPAASHYNPRGHYAALKHWHRGLCRIDTKHLVKHPRFLLTELDAAVLRRTTPEDDSITRDRRLLSANAKQDFYYQAFHNLRGSGNYRVCTDLLEWNNPRRLQTVVEATSSAVRDHPVFRLCVRKYWRRVMAIYIPLIILLLSFASVFTWFMATYTIQPGSNRTDGFYNSSLGNETLSKCVSSGGSRGLSSVHVTLLMLACLSLIGEGLEMFLKKGEYFRVPHNLMDWFTYVGCIVVVVSTVYSQEDGAANGAAGGCLVYGSNMWVLGLLVQIIAWFNFISKCSVIPSLGIYVSMVELVFWSFVRFSPALLLYLVAFGLTFHLALPGYFGYADAGMSVLNTWVMMTGEMGYLDLAGSDDLVALGHNQWLPHVLYVMFLVVLSLIIMNLLTGIAVSDVNAIMDQSEVRILLFQVELCCSAYGLMDAVQAFYQWCAQLNPCKAKRYLRSSRKSPRWFVFRDGKFVTTPTVGHNFEYVSAEPYPLLLRYLDSILFGPLRISRIQESLEEMQASKADTWGIVPNMAWREARMDATAQDTAMRIEGLRRNTETLGSRLKSMDVKDQEMMKKMYRLEENALKTNGNCQSIVNQLEKIRNELTDVRTKDDCKHIEKLDMMDLKVSDMGAVNRCVEESVEKLKHDVSSHVIGQDEKLVAIGERLYQIEAKLTSIVELLQDDGQK